MKTFILIFALVGQPPTYLGEYDSLVACNQAIRQVMSVNIYKTQLGNPKVKEAIDIQMKFQQEYQCVPKQGK